MVRTLYSHFTSLTGTDVSLRARPSLDVLGAEEGAPAAKHFVVSSKIPPLLVLLLILLSSPSRSCQAAHMLQIWCDSRPWLSKLHEAKLEISTLNLPIFRPSVDYLGTTANQPM